MKKKQKFSLWRQKFMASIHAIGLESEEVGTNLLTTFNGLIKTDLLPYARDKWRPLQRLLELN